MTNNQIAALVAAAEKTKATRKALIADQDSQDAVNTYDQAVEDWCELANPSAILSLVARLREADELIWAAFAHTRRPTSAEAEWRDRARTYMEKHDVK